MSLPKAFLEEIRARVPLSDVIGKRMKLTRAGREFKGCCPFHKEKTPSFYVNDQKAFYHCFGCGAHGDSIRFLMDHDNLKFMEAVEHLASTAGLQVPKPTPEEAQKFKRQMSMYDMMEIAAKHYEAQLHAPENKKILKYLVDRGLSMDTIRGFRLGYAPDSRSVAPAQAGAQGSDEKMGPRLRGGDALGGGLAKAGFTQDDLIEAGLFRTSERNKGEMYPFFRDRVMFPVTDYQGRIVAFGGRVLAGAPKEAPKYINSPESPIFHKGRNLYALSRARKAIGDGAPVVVVEGYMDVIALHQAGFPAAVAPLGTALTETQIEELWKAMPEGARAPILCFDGDSAGQRAATRALDRLLPILKPDHSARFAFLPEEHDPDSLVKAEGRGAMDRVLTNAISLFDMLWSEESRGRDFSQPETRAGFKSGLIRRARGIAEGTVQEFFLSQINNKIDEVFLKQRSFEKTKFGKGRPYGRKAPPESEREYRPLTKEIRSPRSKRWMHAKILIAAMIHYPELYEEFSEAFGMLKTDSSDYDKVKAAIISLLDRENGLDYQAVKKHLTELGHGEILEQILDPSLKELRGFANPGQPYDKVRAGWADMFDILSTGRSAKGV